LQYLQNQDLALCQDTKITTFFHFLIVKKLNPPQNTLRIVKYSFSNPK